MAKGFKQKYGVDYTKTFFPMDKYVTLRMMIAVEKYFDSTMDQLDVITAFLYGKLKENLFCEVPEGVEVDEGFDCFELVKQHTASLTSMKFNFLRVRLLYWITSIQF